MSESLTQYKTPESFEHTETGLTPWELCPKVALKDNEYGKFDNENSLCDYIEINITDFCTDLLEEDFLYYEREWDMNINKIFGPRPKRVDFMLKTNQSDCILVECKNPSSSYSELRNGVSQLMSYHITSKENGITPDRLVLVSSKHHDVVVDMIKEFNLPIEYFLVKEGQMLKARI